MGPGVCVHASTGAVACCCSVHMPPGVPLGGDGEGTCFDTHAGVVLEEVALDADDTSQGGLNSEFNCVSSQVMEPVVDDQQVGDAAGEMHAVDAARRAAKLDALDDDIDQILRHIDAVGAAAGYAYGPADALGGDGGVAGVDVQAGLACRAGDDRAVFQQDGEVGLVDDDAAGDCAGKLDHPAVIGQEEGAGCIAAPLGEIHIAGYGCGTEHAAPPVFIKVQQGR